jgi:hypothetical protein
MTAFDLDLGQPICTYALNLKSRENFNLESTKLGSVLLLPMTACSFNFETWATTKRHLAPTHHAGPEIALQKYSRRLSLM